MKRAFLFFAAGLAIVACGGQTDNSQDGGTQDAGNGCPSTPPVDGADCNVGNLECEYGTDPRFSCNEIATCKQGFWSVSSFVEPSCPTAPNPTACPASASSSMQCSGELSCRYGNVWCGCIGGGALPPSQDGGVPQPVYSWMCASPQAGCPASRPKLGTSCSQPSLECDYAPCGTPDGLTVRCDETTGTWVSSATFCAGGA